ncbi:ATP-binding protein [Alicyclobacillus acidiphilus]|uniref:ATP-binding protein n=1 Tax=Alicyclobacillus acidiphilus TaxID=182455 RepID=UPI00082BD4FD|nr:ATP-binding protein [Alicyclobacillus acidiphilus]
MEKRKYDELPLDRWMQYESIFQNHPLSMIGIDMTGRISDVNDAFVRLIGFSANELLGQHVQCVMNPEDVVSFVRKHVHRVGDTTLHDRTAIRLRTKHHRLVPCQFVQVPMGMDRPCLDVYFIVKPITNEDGLEVVVDALQSAIEEHAWERSDWSMVCDNAEDYLYRSQYLSIAGQLAAGVAHEIRNPLTAVKGFLKLLPTLSDRNQAIDIMMDEIGRIEQIVNELLVLSKSQQHGFADEDIGYRFFEVIQLLRAQAILENVEIELNIEDDLPPVACEANRMKQVFINLLKNSMEAMPGGGKVDVRIAKHGVDKVSIQVRDHGVGMTKEQLRQLGEPFYTTKDGGTGLGWMISRRIVQEHAGRLSVESEPGKGTTVVIELPIAQSVSP